jgi:hypothetical protein
MGVFFVNDDQSRMTHWGPSVGNRITVFVNGKNLYFEGSTSDPWDFFAY